jgi:methionyl-tRNA formyltransferase
VRCDASGGVVGIRRAVIRIAYFGLPLGALLLENDGNALQFAVLSPAFGPGRRRLHGRLQKRMIDARDFEEEQALDDEVHARFSREPPDLIVSWYWTRRLSAAVLGASRLGAIGVHPSLLPRHRGPNPFFAAIDAGDTVTGVTVHRLTPAYDEGDVLLQEALEVGPRNSWQLARALDRPSLRALRRVVRGIAEGDAVRGTPQDEARATWAPEPHAELLSVNWTWTTERVLGRIRALSPVPGLAIEIRGTPLFVTEARPTPEFPRTLLPGEAAVTPSGVVIRTGDLAISLERVQIACDDEEDGEDTREVRGAEIAAYVGLPSGSADS